MNLEQVLREPEFAELSDEEAFAFGNEIVVIRTDPTAYTWSGLGEKLALAGVDVATLVSLPTLVANMPGGAMFDKCLSSGGFDFSSPFNREALTAGLAGASPEATGLINAMLAIGVVSGTRWQSFGIDPPTVANIAATRANATDQAAITLFLNNVFNPLINSGTATPADIKELVASWEPE